jgi:hypothetical protein
MTVRPSRAQHASRCTANIQSAWPASITTVRRACRTEAVAPARMGGIELPQPAI